MFKKEFKKTKLILDVKKVKKIERTFKNHLVFYPFSSKKKQTLNGVFLNQYVFRTFF